MTEMEGTATRVATIARLSGNAKLLITCLRPKQWTKNGLLLAPLVFAGKLFEPRSVLQASFGALFFSLLAGGLYIINDALDIERDKQHPTKCNRPLASGKLSLPAALVFAAGTISLSLGAAFTLGLPFGIIAALYAANVLSYSLWIKHLVILDVFSISFGFVLRAAAGAYAIGVGVSPWLVICTICLSLFLGLTKRRVELSSLKDDARSHRSALEHYSLPMLDKMIAVVTPSTLMCYSLYTFTASNDYRLMYTIPLVIFGLLRYLYLAECKDVAGAPETALLGDMPLFTTVLLWGTCVVTILYFV